MEECSELIKAISKLLRKDCFEDKTKAREDLLRDLTEEIADVYICLDYLQTIYHIQPKDIQKWIDLKQKRQEERDHDHI